MRFEVISRNCLCGVFAVVMMITFIGCGSDLVTVTGTVTLDGEPLGDAFVEFTPQVEGGSVSYGRTDENGKYEMMFSLSEMGAVPGENVVSITTADVGDGEPGPKERVPKRYNEESELTADVVAGKANEINFTLTTEDAEIVQPDYDPDA